MINVIYEDDNVIVADKPQRMCVDDDGARQTLVSILAEERGAAIYPCHRIDAMTGGLVLLAKSKAVQLAAFKEFADSTADTVAGGDKYSGIVKTYQCALTKEPRPASGMLTHYLLKDSETGVVGVYDGQQPGAVMAVTEYRVVRGGALPIVEAVLHTGRTHQLRAQFARIGCPILGDDKYGDRQTNRWLRVRKVQLFSVKMAFEATSGLLEYLRGKVFTAQPRWAACVQL